MIELAQELRWQLRRSRAGLLSFIAGIAVFEFIQPVALKSFGDLDKLLPLMAFVPPAFFALMHVTPDFLSASGVAGFLSLGFTHPVFIVLSSASIIWYACRSLAGEMQRGSIQFSLSRPVTRHGLYLSRIAGIIVVTTLISVAGPVGMIAGIKIGGLQGHVDASHWVVVFFACWLLVWAIGGLALLGSAASDSMSRAVSFAIAIVVVSYVIDYFAALWTLLQRFEPFSIFRYFAPSQALATGGLPLRNAVILLAIGAAGAIAGGVIFAQRDLPV